MHPPHWRVPTDHIQWRLVLQFDSISICDPMVNLRSQNVKKEGLESPRERCGIRKLSGEDEEREKLNQCANAAFPLM